MSLVVPALLDSFPDSLGVFPSIILVEIRRLDVRGGRSVRVIEQALNAGQDSCHVICRTPSILQNIQAEFSSTIDVWVKHLADELHTGRLVGVLFFEVHDKAEGAILKGSVCWADDDGIPSHDIICYRRCGDAGGRISLHALEVTHETAASRCRHDEN